MIRNKAMISQETKDQIDDIATDIAVTRGTEERRQAINQEILNYAEKLEEKEIERIKEKQRADWFESEFNRMVANKKHEDARLEEKDKEIDDLKTKLITVYAETTSLMEQFMAKDRELAQLKEIAETMAKALEAQPNMYDSAIFAKRVALTGYAEWCKQNFK